MSVVRDLRVGTLLCWLFDQSSRLSNLKAVPSLSMLNAVSIVNFNFICTFKMKNVKQEGTALCR